jgi:hypothetical protein
VFWDVDVVVNTIDELIEQAQVGQVWRSPYSRSYLRIGEGVRFTSQQNYPGCFDIQHATWTNSNKGGFITDMSGTVGISPKHFPLTLVRGATESSLKLVKKLERGEVSCLMAPLPASSEIEALQDLLPDEVIYKSKDTPFGREKHPHITVVFGIVTEEVQPVQDIVHGTGPITISFDKKTTVFSSAEYDVVKVDVESPQLRELNTSLIDLSLIHISEPTRL